MARDSWSIGASVALGPFDNGAAVLLGIVLVFIIFLISAFVGYFATARANMLFVLGGGRIWELVFWVPVFCLLIPPVLMAAASPSS